MPYLIEKYVRNKESYLSDLRKEQDERRKKWEEDEEEERMKIAREVNRFQELADQQRTAKKSWGEKLSGLAKTTTSKVADFFKKYPSPVSMAKDDFARDVIKGIPAELPKAVRDVTVNKPSEFFFRPTARFGASAALSGAKKLGLTDAEEVGVQPERSAFDKYIGKPIFGEEPIKTLKKEGQEILGGFGVGEEKAGQFGLAASMALGSLDFIPGSRFAKNLVKAKTVSAVRKVLGKSAEQYSDDVVKLLSKSTKEGEVGRILKEAGREVMDTADTAFQRSPYKSKLKSIQSSLDRKLDLTEIRQLEDMSARNVGLDEFRKFYKVLAKKVKAKPKPKVKKSVISKELEPLAKEARKYKSAEEFVKGQAIIKKATDITGKKQNILKITKSKGEKLFSSIGFEQQPNKNFWKKGDTYAHYNTADKTWHIDGKVPELKTKSQLTDIYKQAKGTTIKSIKKAKKITKTQDKFLKKSLGITGKVKKADLPQYKKALDDFENIEVMKGKKLKDTLKISYGADNVVAAAVTKQDIAKIKTAYKGKISDKWVKPKSLKGIKQSAKLPAKIHELPHILFKKTGLKKQIYDPIRNVGERMAEEQLTQITNRLQDAGLFKKKRGWFLIDKFNISKNSSEKIGKYFLTRQGKDFNVLYKDLARKEKKFVDIFDSIIKDLEPQFRKVAKLNNKKVRKIQNYAPIASSKDLKMMDREGAMEFMLKHPSFSALKSRKEFVPKEMYELDYRQVAARWLNGITTFNNVGAQSPQVKLLIESKQFKKVVGGEMAQTTQNWLKSVLNPHIPKDMAGRVGFASAKFARKTMAVGALGLNYAPVIKQTLTQIAVAICEKALPKARSKFAKSFGIKVSDLPSITERKGNLAIADMQGKIGKMFTGGLTGADKLAAQTSLNGLLDKNWYKYLKANKLKQGDNLSNETRDFIIQKSQDTLDLWFGGMTKSQIPPVFRSEAGKLIEMFLYPMVSQLNGFYYHVYKAKGLGKSAWAAGEVAAAATSIAYMEQVIVNLSPKWDDKEGMTKDILSSLACNVPLVAKVVYAIDSEQPLQISPGIAGISTFIKELAKEEKDVKALTFKGAEVFGLPKPIRKVTEGVKVIKEKGYRSKQEKLLAPVESKMEQTRSLLRGKFGSLAAKKYVENVGKKVERPIFDKGLEMVKTGDNAGAQKYVDSLSDEDYEDYKKGKTSYKRDNTIRVDGLLEYDPKKAIAYVQALPEVEAKRIVDNLDDEQWEIYKKNK